MRLLPYIPMGLSVLHNLYSELIDYSSTEPESKETQQALKECTTEKIKLVATLRDNAFNMGCHAKFFGTPIITYDPILEIDLDAFKFCLKHELAHDHLKHSLMRYTSKIAARCLAAVAINHYIGPKTAFVVSVLPFLNDQFEDYTSRECQADRIAIASSSIEELKGGIHLFQAILNVKKGIWEMNQNYKDAPFPQFLNRFDENGNDRVPDNHPPLTERIGTLKKALEARGEVFEANQKRLNKLQVALWSRIGGWQIGVISS